MKLPEGTLDGYPTLVDDVVNADSVVMMEFGSDPRLTTNQEIVDYVYGNEQLRDLPKFVSGSIAKILVTRGHAMDNVQIFEGPSATNTGENTGTYGELLQLRKYRDENPGQFEHAVLATNGHNVGNIMRQTQLSKLALTGLIVPEGLPRGFDWHSHQIWTNNWLAWASSARLRQYILMRKGH